MRDAVLLWHISLSLDQGWLNIDAFRHCISHSLCSCALWTGWWHFRVTQCMCASGVHLPQSGPPERSVNES